MAYVIPKDSQVMAKKGALFIVADGMGGHAAGEVASEIAVDTVSNAYYQDESDDIPLSLMNAIKRANALIHQRAAENMMRSGMGTTCVAAVLRGSIAYIANVGDSRAYMVHNGHSKQVSQDHSWVEEQVRAGLLTKDQARSHAQRNVITRCLGTQSEVEVDVFSETLQEGDTFVLCSDGLSGPVTEDDLRAIINQYLPSESVYHLVERANANGGPDNITAIVIRVLEPGDDPPGVLYPVHAGNASSAPGDSTHVADESTAVLGRIATPSLTTIPSPRMDEGRSPSRPLGSANEQALPAASSSIPASHAAVTVPRKRRSRLLFPTVAISLLLVLALIGTAGYLFFIRPTYAQAFLDQANSKIGAAQKESTSNPTQALRDLSLAQAQLHDTVNVSLDSAQTTQFQQLQQNLVASTRQALTNYNKLSLITTVPCAGSLPSPVSNVDNQSVHIVTTAMVKSDTTHVQTFALGSDNMVYLLNTNGNTLNATKVDPKTSDRVLLLSGDTQHLYLLTELPVSKQTGSKSDYTLHVYNVDPKGALSEVGGGMPVQLTPASGLPKLMTAWDNDVYIIAMSSNQTDQAQILDFNVTQPDTQPQPQTLSISSPVVSVAALSNKQLFLLHSDGTVKSLVASSTKPLEAPVALTGIVPTPWPLDIQHLSANTAFSAPSPDMSKFVTIPPPSLAQPQTYMATGLVNRVNHLYLADNTNHRVLDFIVNGGQANTNRNVGGNVLNTSNSANVQLQLSSQYASPSALPIIQSMALDPIANRLDLLTNTTDMTNARQTAIDVSSATACSSAP
ncbi:serine/threonine-protein phosphatase [Ktedonobacteria bacterium brp13]|nr:serine/threonine-protein phosphatase [Ktedonobacteria bacterium brp13]